jgi:hypothetical protein
MSETRSPLMRNLLHAARLLVNAASAKRAQGSMNIPPKLIRKFAQAACHVGSFAKARRRPGNGPPFEQTVRRDQVIAITAPSSG